MSNLGIHNSYHLADARWSADSQHHDDALEKQAAAPAAGPRNYTITVNNRPYNVFAVPMAARVVNKVGLEANPQNHLIMHAMGAKVSGIIGSAVAAGVLLALL